MVAGKSVEASVYAKRRKGEGKGDEPMFITEEGEEVVSWTTDPHREGRMTPVLKSPSR